MSGAAFAAKGASTGQAPTTTFFGYVPDRYNMLLPFYSFNNGTTHGTVLVSTLPSAIPNNISKWIPWDDNWGNSGGSHITASIGSTTTAPDGTSTGYHVTEGTNTGYHIMVAGTDDLGTRINARRRLAVFAKAAERTRMWMFVGEFLNLNGTNSQFESGVRAVFDLAGGQIAVQPFLGFNGSFPLNYSPVGAGMIPYGNGWYLCYMDISNATNSITGAGCLQSAVGPDSGSGTGAISNSYTGNGTSGIYVWNTNMLPPRAYGINTVSFFDDFTSLSTIDVNNTQAPGFNWYCSGSNWPQIGAGAWTTPIPPGTLTVGSYGGSTSVLTVPPGGNPNPNVTSASYITSNGTVVGTTFKTPMLLEFKGAYPQNATNSDELAWWTEAVEWLVSPTRFNLYQEIDFFDNGSAGSDQYAIFAVFDSLAAGGNDYQGSPQTGTSLWNSVFGYRINAVVIWNGAMYQSLGNNNAGNQPDLTIGTHWSVFTPDSSQPTVANTQIIDSTQLNLWTMLWLPDRSQYSPFDDTGCMLLFFNGVYCVNPESQIGGEVAYGSVVSPKPGLGTNSTIQPHDGFHMMFIIGSARGRSILSDYVRVTQ